MKRFGFALITLFFLARPLLALSATTNDVQGTWKLDIEASERAILKAPPYKMANHFAMATGMWCCILLKFDGHSAIMGLYGEGGNPGKYEFTSAKNTELSYIFKNIESQPASAAKKQSVLIVSILSDSHLSLHFPNDLDSSPYLSQLRWKRADFDSSRTSRMDAKPMMDGWLAALQRIQRVLDHPPSSNSVNALEH